MILEPILIVELAVLGIGTGFLAGLLGVGECHRTVILNRGSGGRGQSDFGFV